MTPLGICEAVLRLTGLDFLSVDQTSGWERAMFPLPRGQKSYFLSDHVKCLKAWSNVPFIIIKARCITIAKLTT